MLTVRRWLPRVALGVMLAASLTVVVGAQAVIPQSAPDVSKQLAAGHKALSDRNWAAAVEAFTDAEMRRPRHPEILFALSMAHAQAGHELAAIAWYRSWLQLAPPSEIGREQVLAEVVRLEIRAEARIRRIAQEASDALDDIGEGDAARTGRLRKLAIQAALARDDIATAQQTVSLLAVDDAGRDAVWTEVALALAAEDAFEQALAAAAKVVNTVKHTELVQSLESRRATASMTPRAERWRALARELSQRREIVRLDAELQDVAKGPAAEVPLRLLAISSRLQLAFARIQRLKELR